ncbi:Histidine kinase-, DNA gyrase B-, and HSP90-like ATPase [Noviherbaspirillum humi]|uniref:histidine kinase n=1 Tax=Noviherbaspirillum humi TaxID=1688639 RepID=A0A239F1M3_9BURK|nr:ATP-binding protein [Noviherbaspirillum humi]SNS50611.1 Histidine kinase-, DNA gyrase B-, and HSP90-like ATPase [Noviherbaspirillum humi]
MTIRTRLIALVLSVMLPAFLASALAVWFVYTEQKLAQDKGIAEAARALALLVDNEIEASETLLRGLAASPLLSQGDIPAFYEHARRVAPTPDTTIVLSSLDGRQLLNTRLPFGRTVKSVNSRLMELRRRAGNDAVVVSDLFIAQVSNRHDFVVQVPVVIDGAVRYHLGRGMSASLMQPLLKGQGLPANWVAAVIDRQGTVVARTADGERFVGQKMNGSLAEKIARHPESGTNDGYTLDGRQVKAFYYRAPESQWTVILSVPTTELRRPAVQAALLLTALMAIILTSAIILARHYASQTVGAVQRLQEHAARLGRGEAVPPAASGLMELDAVQNELVSASNRIRQNQTELKKKVAEAIESTERAQRALLQAQKLEALGRLTGGVAHDFNNVLQTLTTSLHLIRIERQPERILQRVDLCEKAIARATALVGQMRSFGRVNNVALETFDPGAAVSGMMPMAESAMPSNIRLKQEIASPIWPVTADPTQLELALLNLLMNARDAMPAGGDIVVRVKNDAHDAVRLGLPAGDYVCIEVTDCGSGMSPEVMQNALDPFFTTKPVDKGTGLGLPQAYGFAAQAGGILTLESALGAGTTVRIHLPRETRRSVPALPAARSSAGRPDVSGTLLLVEDDELVRHSMAPLLAEAGFNVMLAGDGDEAWAMIRSGAAIDAILSDIVMPGTMNGVALARHVRAHYPAIAVLLVTGYSDEASDIDDIRLLPKPYQVSTVIDILAAAIAERRAAALSA